MDTLSYKTVSVNKQNSSKTWVLVDAENEILGRLASRVAMMLRGKHKPSFTPHADCGDQVIVINAEKVRLTGQKMEVKSYRRHTGYPGGQREPLIGDIMKKKPEFPVENAVKGMLPKTKLGRALLGNLKVYAGASHPHEAQNPQAINLNDIK